MRFVIRFDQYYCFSYVSPAETSKWNLNRNRCTERSQSLRDALLASITKTITITIEKERLDAQTFVNYDVYNCNVEYYRSSTIDNTFLRFETNEIWIQNALIMTNTNEIRRNHRTHRRTLFLERWKHDKGQHRNRAIRNTANENRNNFIIVNTCKCGWKWNEIFVSLFCHCKHEGWNRFKFAKFIWLNLNKNIRKIASLLRSDQSWVCRQKKVRINYAISCFYRIVNVAGVDSIPANKQIYRPCVSYNTRSAHSGIRNVAILSFEFCSW